MKREKITKARAVFAEHQRVTNIFVTTKSGEKELQQWPHRSPQVVNIPDDLVGGVLVTDGKMSYWEAE